MTDMTQFQVTRERYFRAYPPIMAATHAEPEVCRKDILQNALDGTFSQETSLEQLFDWLEGGK